VPPAKPALPVIQSEELDSLSDEVFYRVQEYITRLADWALEQKAMLEAICE
jgi:hypothetical protein